MKKFITMSAVLLLMFSLMLTGCGGGTEEPAAAEEPTVTEEPVAEDTITVDDIGAKYNEAAELFTELDDALLNNGTYDANPDVKASMDYNIDFLDKAVVVIQSGEMTEDEMPAVYSELQVLVDQMNGFKDTYL